MAPVARGPDRSAKWTLFANTTTWEDIGTPALDLDTGQATFPADHDIAFWKAHGHGGTGRIVCLECWRGDVPGVQAGTPVPLIYRAPGDKVAHFAHPPGRAHDPVGQPGETIWHQKAKRLLRSWALAQTGIETADLEWTTADRLRRADVRVVTDSGLTLALEAQQRPIPPSEWRTRRASYANLHITDYWFWPTTTSRPETSYDGLTSFAIDPESGCIGLIVSLWPPRTASETPRFEWPPLLSKPLAAVWAAPGEWTLDERGVHPPRRLTDLCQPASMPTKPRVIPTRYQPRGIATAAARTQHLAQVEPVRLNGAATDTRRCTGCGWPLDPIWNDVGHHPGC